MPQYIYKAMKRTGEKIEGEYKADNKDEVLAMLKSNQAYPLSIVERVEGKNL